MLVMWQHLLPGLLCACIGFLATRCFARLTRAALPRAFAPLRASAATGIARVVAVTLVLLAPIALITLGLSQAREYIIDAPDQYRELLDYTARTVLELRSEAAARDRGLPARGRGRDPARGRELHARPGRHAGARWPGAPGCGALLFAYVGLIIGGLAAVAHAPRTAPAAVRGAAPAHHDVRRGLRARSSRRSSGSLPSTRC